MAKTTAPLLGFSAGGQMAKSMVYASWKGRGYARRYVIPTNPNSTAQKGVRKPFAFLNAMWKIAPVLFQTPWQLYAKGQVMTDRNALISKNIKGLGQATSLATLVFTPAPGSGLPPTTVVVTPGSGTLTAAFTNPTGPAGWVLFDAVFCAILEQSPQAPTDYVMHAGDDLSTMDSVALTGLTASPYRWAAWLIWTKPDGTKGYSSQIIGTSTPT